LSEHLRVLWPQPDTMLAAILSPLMKALRILLVFCYVTIGWLLFKLDSFADVIHYLARLIEFPPDLGGVNHVSTQIMLVLVTMTALYQIVTEVIPRKELSAVIRAVKPAVLAAMVVFIVFGSGDSNVFIYFQF
jgi:alginate O-acetyltransferase complex protein AlgI